MTCRICSTSMRTGGSPRSNRRSIVTVPCCSSAGVELQGLVDQPVDIGRQQSRSAHARELGELIHEALECLDLGDDRVGAFGDQRARVGGGASPK